MTREKNIIILLIFLLTLQVIVYGQKATLKIEAIDSLGYKYSRSKTTDIKVTKGFKTIYNGRLRQLKTIPNLKLGKYKIRYLTIFNQLRNVKVNITTDSTFIVKLDVRYFNYKKDRYVAGIDRLRDGETYQIVINYYGCLINTSHNDMIEISRNDDSFEGKLCKYHRINDSITYAELDSAFIIVNRKILTGDDIVKIRDFETKLRYMKRGDCTSSRNCYVILRNRKIFDVTDGRCKWKGYDTIEEIWK